MPPRAPHRDDAAAVDEIERWRVEWRRRARCGRASAVAPSTPESTNRALVSRPARR